MFGELRAAQSGRLEILWAATLHAEEATLMRLRRQQAAIVMVTHENKFLAIADRMVTRAEGRLVASP
jgi:ABC-type lipoprotein export system ATPase subunit